MFGNEAPRYWKAGLFPVPLRPKTKAPFFDDWQIICPKVSDKDKDEWTKKYHNYNIGLALGTEFNNAQLVAIDIDDEEVMDAVLFAVGKGPTKRGMKGGTVFCLADHAVVNSKIYKYSNGKKGRKAMVEILAKGSQTVLPPSVHPDTKLPYVWVGPELLDSLNNLPFVSVSTIDEIRAYGANKENPIQSLNEMVWAGVNGGGDTHDTCVAAVACMVSRGWTDPEIHNRINRAKRESCERVGESYNWPQATKTIQEWIDSARAKGMTDSSKKGKKEPKIPPERVMCAWAAEHLGGRQRLVCFRGQLRQYQGGYWPQVDIDELLRAVYTEDPVITERQAKSAISILQTMVGVAKFGETDNMAPKNDPKKQRICLVNGTLNLRTGELERHAPEHELLHKLDFDWDEEATCPVYDRVMTETFAGEDSLEKENLWDEFCGLTLVDDMSLQKLLFLVGGGGNGKGTLVRVLESMHDPMAIGSVSITDLNDERKRTSLVGKLLNISSEESRLNTIADAYLKKITGEDAVDTRQLYKETSNNVKLSVRFLELVNDMPTTNDTTDALRRRMIILSCNNKVLNQDTDLQIKLRAERSGILKRWVNALHRLYERGQFLEPKTSTEAVDKYLLENDPVRYWIEDCCDKGEGRWSPSRELFAHYKEWADVIGLKQHQVLNEIMWGRRLVSLGYPVEVVRVGKMTVRQRRLKIKEGQGF